jgi:predicted metal-dependent phosphoesterase TrpH
VEPPGATALRCFVDLHCHTARSFDSLSDPVKVARAAAQRGITHLAITDHDRIDGALEAREHAPEGLTVIVGEEVRTADGDIVALWIDRPVPPGLPAAETIDRIHAQGGLAGVPHPFDRFRGSAARDGVARLESLAPLVDYVEAFNARVPYGAANERAAAFAREHHLPGVAVSDAHTLMEVGVAYTVLEGPIATSADLRRALADTISRGPAALVTGRASYLVRGFMPVAKLVQRWRGNRRGVQP